MGLLELRGRASGALGRGNGASRRGLARKAPPMSWTSLVSNRKPCTGTGPPGARVCELDRGGATDLARIRRPPRRDLSFGVGEGRVREKEGGEAGGGGVGRRSGGGGRRGWGKGGWEGEGRRRSRPLPR